MRLLALVEAPDHVCFRYRIQAFAPALDRSGWSIVQQPLERGIFARWRQLRRAADFDAVILQRKLLPPWQLQLLRKNAARLVFDFDDAVLYRDSYSSKGPHSRQRVARFSRTVKAADVVIAGNRFLADRALETGGARADRVQVIPTCIDLDLYPPQRSTPFPPAPDLVWIGSSSTLQGLEKERGLWERLGEEIPGLTMRIICDRFPEFRGVTIVKVPWDRETEARELACGGIGIGLLPDDPWSRGKCGLKILQYQAAGLPVIANPVGSHNELVRQCVDGYLASTPDEWVAALRHLIADSRLRRQMGAAGRDRVERSYSTRAWGEAFVWAVTGEARPFSSARASGDREPGRNGMLMSSAK